MIKAIIFDLDNCLASAREPGEALFQPAFDAIRAAAGHAFPEPALRAAFQDIWSHPFNWVAERHRFTNEMREAGWRVFQTLEVNTPMRGYGDLEVLGRLPLRRFLVTSGFRRLQESKIRALNLGLRVTGYHIDAIDEPNRPGKRALFERILKQFEFLPSEVLVVGDNPESEIAAGNALGIRTVQTLRPGVERTNAATYHIESLNELPALIARG